MILQKMLLKINNSKYLIKVKYFVIAMGMFLGFSLGDQEIIEDKVEEKATVAKNTSNRIKIDGVAAVVGDFVVLDSDIDKQYAMLEAGGVSTADITRCQLFGKLLEDKLYVHHAIQDSIEVNDAEIRAQIDQQINVFAQQIGSMEKLIAYYKKQTEQELRDEMFELNKNNKMAALMQQKIVEDIEVTPEEVRQFFRSIPEDDRPVFGTELKVAQIVVIPETTKEEEQKVIDRL